MAAKRKTGRKLNILKEKVRSISLFSRVGKRRNLGEKDGEKSPNNRNIHTNS